ncbi:MAG: biotin transporter BioY [Planctomycetota bacterium]
MAASPPAPDTTAPDRDAASDRAMLEALLRAAAPFLGAWIISQAAQLSIPIGDYRVPFTFGDLAVVSMAYCLGPKRGMLGIGIYLAAGALGMPVFAENSEGVAGSGLRHLLGVTGGYLLGYFLCQPVVGLIIRRKNGTLRGWGALVLAFLAAQSIIYAVGVPWLWLVKEDATLRGSIMNGMVIFLPFVPIKCIAAVLIGRISAPWAMKRLW